MTATYLRGGTLFDSVHAAYGPNPGIRLANGRIESVGGVPEDGDAIVDADGKTILPGLMNLHGHFAWDGFSDLEGQCKHDGPLGYAKAARGLIAALQGGVTTFRDLACVHDTGLVAKRAVELGLLPGPKVLACGRAVCRTGGHIWFGNREADGVAEVRKAVREQVKDGADWIKLMAHGYTQDEVTAAVEEAHELGVPITTDAGASVELAVNAGVDCIEHGGDYSDAFAERIAEKGIWVVPTLSPVLRQARYGDQWGMKPSVIERRRRQLADSGRHEGLVRARRAGVRFGFGTDSGSPVVPHDAIKAEIEALLEFGIFDSASDVLQTATIRSAELIGREQDTGSIEQGKAADVVIVDGDLEHDLGAIERVRHVWVDGRQVVVDGRVGLPDPRDYQTFSNVGA